MSESQNVDIAKVQSALPDEAGRHLMDAMNAIAGLGNDFAGEFARAQHLSTAISEVRTVQAAPGDKGRDYVPEDGPTERAAHVDTVWRLYQKLGERPEHSHWRDGHTNIDPKLAVIYEALAKSFAALMDSNEPNEKIAD